MKLINAIQQLLVKNDKWGEEEGWGGGGGITEGELNRGFTVFSNTPYEKSAYHYIAVGVIRHLHLNADLSFLLKCTKFSIDFKK